MEKLIEASDNLDEALNEIALLGDIFGGFDAEGFELKQRSFIALLNISSKAFDLVKNAMDIIDETRERATES